MRSPAMELVRDRMASRQQDLKLYLEYRKPGEMDRVRIQLVRLDAE